MKIIKKGIIENGKLVGCIFDCEGGPINLNELMLLAKNPQITGEQKAKNNE
jgi:hypothetical protein